MPISKAEFLKKLNHIISLSNLSEENKKFFLEEYFSDNSDPVLDMTRRFITKAQPDVKKLLALFGGGRITPDIFVTPIPLLCLSPDITKIRVYPNVLVDNINYLIPEVSVFFNNNSGLQAFTKRYKEAKETPRLQKLWGSLSQSWKRIKYYEDLPVSQVLSKYLNKEKLQIFSKKGLFDEDRGIIIRKLANKINEARKPLEIVFAETPEDFFDMYETGPASCMAWKGLSDRTNLWKAMLEKKLCPTSFFSYCPITKGAYVKRGDRVICRTLIYTLNEKQFFGRIFSDSPEIESQFISSMKEKGIVCLTHSIDSAIISNFSIPGIEIQPDKYICPFPYFDNISFRMKVQFEDGIFYFGKEGGIATQRTGGYLFSKDYVSSFCFHCHHTIHDGDEVVAEDDISKSFCSWNCAKNNGYVRIKNGRGDVKCGKLTGSEIKSSCGDYFTTLQAAKDCGYYPLLISWGFVPEEQTTVVEYCWDVVTSLNGWKYGILEEFFKKHKTKIAYENIIANNIIPVTEIKTQKSLIFDPGQPIFSTIKSTIRASWPRPPIGEACGVNFNSI